MNDPMPTPQYVYRARLVRVVDGDTAILCRDCGRHITETTSIRLLGINTPEIIGVTAAAGKRARVFAQGWFAGASADEWPLVLRTELDQNDKYGRLLGVIYRMNDGQCLNDELVTAGQAVPYDGHGPRT